MNRAQIERARAAEESEALLTAARHETFGLGELWRELRGVNYSRLSQILLRWWREDGLTERYIDGEWRTGQTARSRRSGLRLIGSSPPRMPSWAPLPPSLRWWRHERNEQS